MSARVNLKHIGDDGSVMGDVYYSLAEFFNGATEAPARIGAGDFVFLWQPDAYNGGEILGNDRGYLGNIEASTRNHGVGFFTRTAYPNPGVKAVIADHSINNTGSPTSFTFRVHNPDDPGTVESTMAAENSRPQSEHAGGIITSSGKIKYTRAVGPGVSQTVIAGTADREELSARLEYFDTFMDLPDVAGTNKWALGSKAKSLRIWNSGSFVTPSSATGVLGFDRHGSGIGDGNLAGTQLRQIWLNGRWLGFSEALGLGSGSFFNGFRPRKITPSGLIWISNPDSTINGVLVPVHVKDNATATGVDEESIKAHPGSAGYQNQHWIMAPAGSDHGGYSNNNTSHFHLPAPLPINVGISSPAATTSPATFHILPDPTPNPVSWHGNSNATLDTFPTFNLSGTPAIGNPVGVKVMKHRKAKVHVYKVAKKGVENDPSTPEDEFVASLPPDDDIVPDKAELEQYLDQLFGWQINCYFDVTIEDKSVDADWSTDGDTDLNHGPNDHSIDQNAIKALVPWNSDANIHIFIIGKHTYIGNGSTSKGVTSPPNATCWVMGRKFASYQTKQHVLETIGHEIGHIFFGPGHPNDDPGQQRGPAPLDGTDQTKRLMCNGEHFNSNSRLIVKGEWDHAERWMADKIDDPE